MHETVYTVKVCQKKVGDVVFQAISVYNVTLNEATNKILEVR